MLMSTEPPSSTAVGVPNGFRMKEFPFPSDALTVGRLRALFPTQFDESLDHPEAYTLFFTADPDDVINRSAAELVELLNAERVLAVAAFDERLGHPWDADADLPGRRTALAGLYVHFGVAANAQEAATCVLGVEALARQWADEAVATRA